MDNMSFITKYLLVSTGLSHALFYQLGEVLFIIRDE